MPKQTLRPGSRQAGSATVVTSPSTRGTLTVVLLNSQEFPPDTNAPYSIAFVSSDESQADQMARLPKSITAAIRSIQPSSCWSSTNFVTIARPGGYRSCPSRGGTVVCPKGRCRRDATQAGSRPSSAARRKNSYRPSNSGLVWTRVSSSVHTIDRPRRATSKPGASGAV